MEGETMATTIRATLGKLAMRHFQTLDDLFCCMIFFVSAIAFWYVIAWVVGTVVKLIFPVVVMFVFMVVFNEHYSTVLPKLVKHGTEFFSKVGNRFGIIANLLDYE
ncbi:hypothetical protein pipiens_013535 [Culex pipiens pipiens]|uniref:Uncharacterized protein n=1 Tax=Culex pipiens pipiens TaxID=38569 RepID=A0ABD1CY23_CULPP